MAPSSYPPSFSEATVADVPEAFDTSNRPDEWKIEQGMAGHKLPILDQTGSDTIHIYPTHPPRRVKDEEAIKSVGDRDKVFARELEGWKGYVEWEKYPEKKAKAHKILTSQTFTPSPEYMFGPIPDTNPVLTGEDFKQWHHAIGGELASVPEDSWNTVLREKHPDMLHLLQFPYNGEPPKRLVTSKVITPNPLHFVRNHGGIPIIDKDKWNLTLDGLVSHPQTYTLEDLKDERKFPRMEKLVTMQCSGTRRIEQISLYGGQGDEVPQAPWAEGAIGTARYVGISLKKVIKDCGGLIKPAKHLEFYGAETYVKDLEVMNYVVSVPWSKVKANEVMLAWEMNGEPLPKIHGYPLRVVVLGYIGARSVKWLYRIKAIENPSRAPVQSREYLYFNQQVGKYNLRPTDGIQIQEMPVSSAIMSPITKQVVIHNGKIRCKGWAYSGGGRWPERVELSADGGFTWYDVPPEKLSKKGKWLWRTWEIDLPCDAEGWIEIVCRCWDNALNTQPLNVRAAWNWGLHVTHSAHRISVYSVNKSRPLTRKRLDKYDQLGIPLAPLTRYEIIQSQTPEEYEEYWRTHEPRDVDE
ncbi:sulfite oxidase [Paecilomyces variotii]|uniref:Sulfite oxidase n=1 Tax=Byssochlamys spectabilis TaxID=264951 RepID=A0A443HJQ3_BYSSP|nr:sulfite oxidase [Paecilomyces variotii]RWQ91987.1 sulfite oxidase [Paecilomyces variotii]